VVRAGDRERALIARELHDSAAQTLAAATYQLAALGRDAEEGVVGPELAERAAAARAMVAGVLEEVRLLAHTVYPRCSTTSASPPRCTPSRTAPASTPRPSTSR
jgi:signal transduction histidine kinase